MKPKKYKVIGNCTVWHYYPSFRGCNTFLEGVLSDCIEKIKFEERWKVIEAAGLVKLEPYGKMKCNPLKKNKEEIEDLKSLKAHEDTIKKGSK